MQPTNTLRPIIPDNACPPRLTAAAGTRLAGTSFLISHYNYYRNSFTADFYKNLLCLPHSRNITGSGFRLLSKIPHCWLIKPGPCLSSSVANHPLRLTKDQRLGQLLPNQQPNPV